MTTIANILRYEQTWRNLLEAKGYSSISITFELNPVNDEFKTYLSFCNTEDSNTMAPYRLRYRKLSTVDESLAALHTWVLDLPHEADAREEQLIRDFALIKERIAASNLSDLIKAEAATLLASMTTNILTLEVPPKELTREEEDFNTMF